MKSISVLLLKNMFRARPALVSVLACFKIENSVGVAHDPSTQRGQMPVGSVGQIHP